MKLRRFVRLMGVAAVVAVVGGLASPGLAEAACPPGQPSAPFPGPGFVPSADCQGWVPTNSSGTPGPPAAGDVLEGTWRITVTPDPGGPPPSQAFHTYFPGGGLIQSNLQSEGPTPGHGTWAKSTNGEYVLSFEKFIGVNILTGQAGVFVFKVREAIKLQGDSYTGRGEAFFCNAGGGQCISLGRARTSAQRLKVEPPA